MQKASSATNEPLANVDRIPRRSFRDLVHDRIREAILSGQFHPGQHLNEVEMAARFGVSATPVREAFRILEQTGLIVVNPHRGAVVRSLTHQDLAEMYSLRAHLERLAVHLARPQLTEMDFAHLERVIEEMEEEARAGRVSSMVEVDVAFHRLIVERSGHRLLLRTWEQIHPSQWTYVTVRVLAQKGPLYIAERHRPLLDLLRHGTQAAVEDAMAKHIDEIGAEALQVFEAGIQRPGSINRTVGHERDRPADLNGAPEAWK